jgi:hypothetical protein
MIKYVTEVVNRKIILFSLLKNMFHLLPVNGQVLNKRSVLLNFHLTTSKQASKPKTIKCATTVIVHLMEPLASHVMPRRPCTSTPSSQTFFQAGDGNIRNYE